MGCFSHSALDQPDVIFQHGGVSVALLTAKDLSPWLERSLTSRNAIRHPRCWDGFRVLRVWSVEPQHPGFESSLGPCHPLTLPLSLLYSCLPKRKCVLCSVTHHSPTPSLFVIYKAPHRLLILNILSLLAALQSRPVSQPLVGLQSCFLDLVCYSIILCSLSKSSYRLTTGAHS